MNSLVARMAADSRHLQSAPRAVWYRPAFCQMALPVSAAAYSISLVADEAGVTVGFAAPGKVAAAPLPDPASNPPGEPAAAVARRKAKSSQRNAGSAPVAAGARTAPRA